jgi:hypothetical protein
MDSQVLNVDLAGYASMSMGGITQCSGGTVNFDKCERSDDSCSVTLSGGATCTFSSVFDFDCNATTATGSQTYVCVMNGGQTCQSTYSIKAVIESFDPQGDP